MKTGEHGFSARRNAAERSRNCRPESNLMNVKLRTNSRVFAMNRAATLLRWNQMDTKLFSKEKAT